MRNYLVRLISTFFYIGHLPFIPGTFASFFALLLLILLYRLGLSILPVTLLILVLGFLSSGAAERLSGRKDPPFIVIDEVAGMFLSVFLIPYDLRIFAAAFLLFRILDTLKPFPSGCLEKLKGGIGIMADDIVAGLYANIILQFVLRFSSFKVS